MLHNMFVVLLTRLLLRCIECLTAGGGCVLCQAKVVVKTGEGRSWNDSFWTCRLSPERYVAPPAITRLKAKELSKYR